MKTKFEYSKIPNSAKYGRSDWSNMIKKTSNLSLEQAKKIAEDDPTISFFFNVKEYVNLEKNGVFEINDAVFFGGTETSLGSARQADTYYVAELFDTEDASTAQWINDSIRKLKINSLIDTSKGTSENPTIVKGGFVFCEFADKKGTSDDILKNYNRLTGTQGEKCTVTDFIQTESNGKATLSLTNYATDKWVSLPKNNAEYVGNVSLLFTDLDAAIEVPDDWKILFLAFPEGVTTISRSQMCGDRTVDSDQKLNIVFLDPDVYKEGNNDISWTTVHETMHALGLPDLYNGNMNRSFGWSLMADCRTGWHITGFEKLILGWHKLSDYYFLKRGILKTDIYNQQAAEGLKKGIIVMPDSIRQDCYFMEIAQPVGRTDDDLAKFNRNGLLKLIAKLERGSGKISPFVSERGNDGTKFGGAANAPFLPKQSFSTMGIFSKDISEIEGGKLNCTIGLDSKFKIIDSAKSMRENEYIKIAGDNSKTFRLDITGSISGFSSDLVKSKDYGFSVYVDDMGVFHWIAGTGADDTNKEIIKTFPPPSPLPQGNYFFKVEKKDPGNESFRVSIYSGTIGDSAAALQYEVFTF